LLYLFSLVTHQGLVCLIVLDGLTNGRPQYIHVHAYPNLGSDTTWLQTLGNHKHFPTAMLFSTLSMMEAAD